jgi:hypothetical protein
MWHILAAGAGRSKRGLLAGKGCCSVLESDAQMTAEDVRRDKAVLFQRVKAAPGEMLPNRLRYQKGYMRLLLFWNLQMRGQYCQ